VKPEDYERIVRVVSEDRSYAAWALGVILGTADRMNTESSEDLLNRAERVATYDQAVEVIREFSPDFFLRAGTTR
jgi:hypothetical protein